MKFLHTSDWHLGRGLRGHDLSAAQQVALDAVIDIAIEHNVDAFVIAGDIFDRAFPAVDDVRRFNRALRRINDAQIPIIVTSGNHDEGARLAAYTELLKDSVTVIGEYDQVGHRVDLGDSAGPVVFYPLPYLDPDGARRSLVAADAQMLERSHEAVMSEAMRRIRIDLAQRQVDQPTTRAVVVAHAFVVSGTQTAEGLLAEQSTSERDISVGGVPSVPAGVFDGVHYVALGHLHGPRTVQEHEPMVRYSGSLLRYSISERNHRKSVTIVDMDGDGHCTVEEIEIPQPARMTRLEGELAELVSGKFHQHHDDFVDIVLTDKFKAPNEWAQLNATFTRILTVTHQRSADDLWESDKLSAAMVLTKSPMDLMRSFYLQESNEALTPSMESILVDVVEQAQGHGKS